MKARLVGPGQLGRVLGGGLLACGVSVDVARRGDPSAHPTDHDLTLVAVGEKDLDAVLASLAPRERERAVLLQNELVPASWTRHGVVDPTVLVVWFEKKAGRALTVVRESVAFGPQAELFQRVFQAVDAPLRVVPRDEGVAALVVKNLYIVGSNVLGLRVGGTTGELVRSHRDVTTTLLRELVQLERARCAEATLPTDDALLEATLEAFLADPSHGTVGRTARERLSRALDRASALGVAMPALRALAAELE